MSEAKGKKLILMPKEFIKKEEKAEKAELHPMSYYTDDRVELVKQIFSTLKPKTIKSLAPAFLKDSTIEEIEELCLNELLGISTKRLKSIIDASKCPTDTESSDDNVNPIEEHISLEEISSESESEMTKKPVKKATKKNNKESGGNENNATDNKGVSVLELLELQARARAIRSQLALEPITKIEVDSDDSESSKRSKTTTAKKDKSSTSTSKVLTNGVGLSLKEIPTKDRKKKLRKRSSSKSKPDSIESKEGKGKLSKTSVKEPPKSNENRTKTLAEQAIKEEERSPSPDVITILPSPETLFISDSSEDETVSKKTEDPKQQSTSNEEITATVNKENEDKENNLNVENEQEPEKENSNADKMDPKRRNSNESTSAEYSKENEEKEENKSEKEDETTKNSEQNDVEISESREDVISLGHDELEFEMSKTEDDDTDSKTKVQTGDSQESISQKSEDISNEEPIDIADDYIELHDSSDTDMEETGQNRSGKKNTENPAASEDLSWNSRWLKSTKVTKVLAASKLGNRLRNKLKMRKVEEAEQLKEVEISTEVPDEIDIFKSQYEDGSVKQYEEIMGHLQSKKDPK